MKIVGEFPFEMLEIELSQRRILNVLCTFEVKSGVTKLLPSCSKLKEGKWRLMLLEGKCTLGSF